MSKLPEPMPLRPDQKMQAEIDKLKAALEEVRELIDSYVDVVDGDYGPSPNKAMKAVQIIEGVLRP